MTPFWGGPEPVHSKKLCISGVISCPKEVQKEVIWGGSLQWGTVVEQWLNSGETPNPSDLEGNRGTGVPYLGWWGTPFPF
jgi:hypothetical protein